MTLEKAREWASRHDRVRDVFHPDAKAAVEVIQSLPDKWVDVEEVQEIIEEMESLPDTTRVSSEIAIATEAWKRRLEALLPSKLPTLADMTPEERAACKWMQCKVETDGGDTPTIAQKEKVADDQAVAKDVCNSEPNSSETPKSSINPEDVPADELWLVERGESQWFAKRIRGWSKDFAWRLTSISRGSSMARDSEITLIHKLVPEPPALPEGMRLADHETLGRIIVSPKEDSDGDHLSFFPDESTRCGADWTYLQKSEFTYLDGETK